MVTKPWDESVASGGGTKRSLRGNDKAEAVTQSAVHADKRSIEDSEERGCGLCSKSLVKQLEASPEEAAENFLSLGYEEKRKVFEKIAKSHNPQKLYVLMGGTSLEYDTNAWKFYSAFGKWHDEKYG
ncbi:hypothetical protein PsorP6_019283 [Peronosclerospora sorghi]|nr:hypothetical protein PsorP6_019274 [Peronosclerospora sorghi]KAI9905117.1 hypothetical protein PsorP6_019283 [Peronosclerospora sorghi]